MTTKVPFIFNRDPDAAKDRLTKPHRLTHPDYCSIGADGTVLYTQEGLQFYNEKCRQAGLPLPLPAGNVEFWAMVRALHDSQTEEIVAMLTEDMQSPSSAIRAIAEGYLTGKPNSAPHVETLKVAKQSETEATAAGANVASLAWHRAIKR